MTRPWPDEVRPLIDRLREAVPGLEWEIDEEGDTLGVEAGVCEWDVWLTPRALRCFRDRFDEPHAVIIKRPSDDEVVRIVTEWHAKTHPAPAAPSLLDRLRTAIPSLTWEQVSEGEWIGRDAHDRDVARIVWRIDLGKRQEYIVACGTGHDDPNAYQASVTSADEAIDRVQRYVGETVARLEAPAAPQPSPQAQALLDALRAQGYEPEHKWVGDGEHVVCENEQARRANDLPGWTYLGGQAGTEYVAEQMHLRISRRRERKAAETATQATGADLGRGSDKTVLVQMEFKPGPEWAALAAAASKEALDQVKQAPAAPPPRLLDHKAFTRLFGEQGDRIATLIEERKYEEATALIEALTEELKAKRQAPKTLTVSVSALDTDAIAATLTQASKEALEQVKQAHEAKGAQTMTKTQALTQTIKLDASEAAWRTAGSQFVKLAREPLVGLLTRHLAPNDDAFRARLAAFLETELGTALLASMLSATLSALPQTTGDVPQKLARELRVRAMADVGDELASVLMGPLLQVMRVFLQDPAGTPAAPALDAPQAKSVEWATAEQKEGAR